MENIDWGNLGFGYMKTDFNVRSYWRDGKWGELTLTDDETITMHMAATCLHYGQEAFEGLKAYRGKDGKVRLFRVEENARRMARTAEYTKMAAPTEELFIKAVKMVVEANSRFIPPYGTGASLYIRPLLVGTGPQVGVRPANEYLFMVFVTPVGPYYKTGFNAINVMIDRDHDRAAPHGTGNVKVGGNYAASLLSAEIGHQKGFPSVLYLDPCEKKYIDECGAANFFGIRDGAYITPESPSILPSITNKSIKQIAADMGLRVETRKVNVSELSTFEEAGSCGTAAVISPVGKIYDFDTNEVFTYGDGVHAGPWTTKLYEKLHGIQFGEIPDPYGWTTVVL